MKSLSINENGIPNCNRSIRSYRLYFLFSVLPCFCGKLIPAGNKKIPPQLPEGFFIKTKHWN